MTGRPERAQAAHFATALRLSSDPQEAFNLTATVQTNRWILAPIYREIAKYEESVKKYRNIEPGEDFKGY